LLCVGCVGVECVEYGIPTLTPTPDIEAGAYT